MKKTENLVITFAILASSILGCAGVLADEIISFEGIRNQYKTSADETRISYLFLRCASLQLAVSALALKGGLDEVSEINRKSAVQYMSLAGAVDEETNKKRGVKNSSVSNNIENAVKSILNVYTDRMQANYAKSGDYITSDNQLKNEITKCIDAETLARWMVQ